METLNKKDWHKIIYLKISFMLQFSSGPALVAQLDVEVQGDGGRGSAEVVAAWVSQRIASRGCPQKVSLV